MIKGVKKFMENEFKILKLIFKYFPKKKKKKKKKIKKKKTKKKKHTITTNKILIYNR